MSGTRSIRERDFQKPFPGYKGRSMVNIFDMKAAGIDGTKMLAEKPHLNGSLVVRHNPISMKNPFGIVLNQKQEKPIASNRSITYLSEKSSGTPMKTLIAQELSKETENKQNTPTVVARLMGLESLPLQQPRLTDRKDQRFGNSHDNLAGTVKHHKWQENNHIGNQVQSPYGKKVYKDVHEVWQQPSMAKIKDNSIWTGNHEENSCQVRMSLVRENFLEAKRLAMDEKFLHSKEFQDAIEILSSNRDLFLKFLEEPNSLFSKHFNGLKSVPSPQKRCITVLRPLNTVGENGEKESGKQLPEAFDDKNALNSSWVSSSPELKPHTLSQPTRIVVLKPSPGKPCDIRKVVPSPTSSSKLLDRQGSCGSLQIDESMRSKELAKEITRRIRESLGGHIKGGDLLSSLLTNGYIGHTSSFNKTESEYEEEEDDSLSDSEIVTPTLRHSWDFLNRSGNSFSLSSISKASYSPESSVTREAKKRLCERLALVASNGDRQEQGHENISTSTLGEMLAVSMIEKQKELNAPISKLSSEEKSAEASSLLFSHLDNEYNENYSGRKLSRSKSLPASSSVFGVTDLDVAVSSSLINEAAVPKVLHKSKSVKFSLKGKLSSIFSSKNKKQTKDKLTISSSVHSEVKLSSGNENSMFGGKADGLTEPLGDICSSQPASLNLDETATACNTSVDDGSNVVPLKDALSLENYTRQNIIQDLDQPSTISISEAPCVNGAKVSLSQFSEDALSANPQALSRSPPIASVARSLPRNGPCLVTTLQSSNHVKSSRILTKADEEQKQFAFVEKLISTSCLSNYASSLNIARWYSLDDPSNPMLLDEYEHIKDKDDLNYNEMRSNERLLFDCVNSSLLLMSLRTTMASYPWSRARTDAHDDSVAGTALAEVVWGIIKSWFCTEDWVVERKSMKIVVDTLVKREVRGRQWAESLWLEMNEFSKEIGGMLLEELIEEALLELPM